MEQVFSKQEKKKRNEALQILAEQKDIVMPPSSAKMYSTIVLQSMAGIPVESTASKKLNIF